MTGTAALWVAPFVDWTASTDLGHSGTAFDVPLRFVWSGGAVSTGVAFGHAVLGLALVATATVFVPFTRVVALGAGAAGVVLGAAYVVRFMVVTDVVDPTRAFGAGLLLLVLGGALLVGGSR